MAGNEHGERIGERDKATLQIHLVTEWARNEETNIVLFQLKKKTVLGREWRESPSRLLETKTHAVPEASQHSMKTATGRSGER